MRGVSSKGAASEGIPEGTSEISAEGETVSAAAMRMDTGDGSVTADGAAADGTGMDGVSTEEDVTTQAFAPSNRAAAIRTSSAFKFENQSLARTVDETHSVCILYTKLVDTYTLRQCISLSIRVPV